MPDPEIEFQRKKLFTERLYRQLETVEEFRFKFTITKITFVVGLLGIGAMGRVIQPTSLNIDPSPALLLAPLVAVLFDILGMAATVAIYRIDAFLRAKGEPDEKEWQYFLRDNPLSYCKDHPKGSFYRCAADGFTVITFVASFLVLWTRIPDWLDPRAAATWFAIVFAFGCFFRCLETKLKDDFSKN